MQDEFAEKTEDGKRQYDVGANHQLEDGEVGLNTVLITVKLTATSCSRASVPGRIAR